MLRTFDIILIGLMIAAASITYKIKHDAQKQMNQVTKLERMISEERDTIDLLKADWSLLTQPNRLQKLVEAFQGQLDLQLVQANQIININDLPQPKPVIFDSVEDILIEASAKDLKPDSTLTGSVTKKTNPAPKGAAQ
ncbi:cell division protein FtsL [Phyllobacterium sp. K27]